MKTWSRKLLGIICALVCTAALGYAWTTPAAKSKKPVSSAQKSTSHATTHKVSSKGKKGKKPRKGNWRTKGQQKIDENRTRQIQEALIREHYLTGEPSGQWDAASQAACRRFQADNGWQDKMVPDSRALIKLGLGPDQAHLLNPESAMTSNVASTHTAPVSTTTPPTSTATSPASNPQPLPESGASEQAPPQ